MMDFFIRQLTMNGKEVLDDDMFLAALEGYHYKLMETDFGISREEVEQNGQPAQMAAEASNVLMEYLSNYNSAKLTGRPRVVIHMD